MNVMLSKTFFPQHPKAGEPTGFKEKVKNGTKRHTCRCNYDYEKQVELQKDGEVIRPAETALKFAVIHFTTFRY